MHDIVGIFTFARKLLSRPKNKEMEKQRKRGRDRQKERKGGGSGPEGSGGANPICGREAEGTDTRDAGIAGMMRSSRIHAEISKPR